MKGYRIEVVRDPVSGCFIASDKRTACYGTGLSRTAAIMAYLAYMLDERASLSRDEARLGKMLKRRLRAIRRFLEEAV